MTQQNAALVEQSAAAAASLKEQALRLAEKWRASACPPEGSPPALPSRRGAVRRPQSQAVARGW